MIASQIELRHLRYFAALAELRHFTRAAERVHVSQPTLSQQIRQLEDAFGSPLFNRIGKQVTLTPAGEALLPHARGILCQVEEACTAVTELRGLDSGQLSVGVVQTVNALLLPSLLVRFSQTYPGIQVSTREVPGDQLEAGVESGAFDLGIGFSPSERPRLATDRLYEEELVVIAARSHPLSARKSIRFSQLEEHPLVLLPRGYCTRELIQASFGSRGGSPRVFMELNSIQSILGTIEQMNAATVLPALSLSGRLKSPLRSIRLTHPTPRRVVGLVWRTGAFRKAAATAFAEMAKAVAHELFAPAGAQRRTAA